VEEFIIGIRQETGGRRVLASFIFLIPILCEAA
jgi:hypothetical protein